MKNTIMGMQLFFQESLYKNTIMTTETTRENSENRNNSPFENVKLFFNKIMGAPAEQETSPLSKGIGSEIPQNTGDEPIKWPLPVKK